MVTGIAEFLFPMPGMGKDKSVRLGGIRRCRPGLGRTATPVKLNDLRYSAGVSVSWTSPIGPLKFSFAKPLNTKTDDKMQRLQFQMGTAF